MPALVTSNSTWEIATGTQQDIVDYLAGLAQGQFSVISYIRSNTGEFSILICKI